MRSMTDLIPRYVTWADAQGMSPRTYGQRDGILRRADAQIPYGLEEANEQEIVDWLNQPHSRCRKEKRRSRATLSNYWYTLSSFYDWATHRWLEYNPMANLVPPKAIAGRSRGLSRAVVADVLERAQEPYRTFVTLALYSGLRCCEIAGLHREDITDTRIDVRDAKGGSPQVAFGHPEIWAAVKDLGPGNLVTQIGGVPDPSWVSIRSALYFRRRLGLVISLHRFRHTFACRLREQGHDLFVIKKAMRHASVRSTEIYAEAGDGEVATAVASLPVPTRPAA